MHDLNLSKKVTAVMALSLIQSAALAAADHGKFLGLDCKSVYTTKAGSTVQSLTLKRIGSVDGIHWFEAVHVPKHNPANENPTPVVISKHLFLQDLAIGNTSVKDISSGRPLQAALVELTAGSSSDSKEGVYIRSRLTEESVPNQGTFLLDSQITFTVGYFRDETLRKREIKFHSSNCSEIK